MSKSENICLKLLLCATNSSKLFIDKAASLKERLMIIKIFGSIHQLTDSSSAPYVGLKTELQFFHETVPFPSKGERCLNWISFRYRSGISLWVYTCVFIPAHVLPAPPAAPAGVVHHTGLRTDRPQAASLSKTHTQNSDMQMNAFILLLDHVKSIFNGK